MEKKVKTSSIMMLMNSRLLLVTPQECTRYISIP